MATWSASARPSNPHVSAMRAISSIWSSGSNITGIQQRSVMTAASPTPRPSGSRNERSALVPGPRTELRRERRAALGLEDAPAGALLVPLDGGVGVAAAELLRCPVGDVGEGVRHGEGPRPEQALQDL